jgi:hypothetical protein
VGYVLDCRDETYWGYDIFIYLFIFTQMNHSINSLRRNNNRPPKEACKEHQRELKPDQEPRGPGLAATKETWGYDISG